MTHNYSFFGESGFWSIQIKTNKGGICDIFRHLIKPLFIDYFKAGCFKEKIFNSPMWNDDGECVDDTDDKWRWISENATLPDYFIARYKNKLNWHLLCSNYKSITSKLLLKYIHKFQHQYIFERRDVISNKYFKKKVQKEFARTYTF